MISNDISAVLSWQKKNVGVWFHLNIKDKQKSL